MTLLRLMNLLENEHMIHAETRRKLAKAEHDRERYKHRIKFLDSQHQVLCRELRAVNTINRVLTNAVQILEGRLFNEQAAAQGAKKETGRAAGV